ncbi:hypothetical protein Tco_1151298 [Tanacetum coccineum]
MNRRGVKEKENLVDQARETIMEIENEQAGVNEFPSMTGVFGNVSNTSSTGMGSQTYAKLLKHDSTKVSNAFDVLSSMADLDNDVGMNSNIPPIEKVNDKQVEDKVRDGKRKEKTVRFTFTKIVDSAGNYQESLLTTTYMYDADEQYDYIVRTGTEYYYLCGG